MIRFRDVLNKLDREHLRKILNGSLVTDAAGRDGLSKVGEFLRRDTYVEEGSVAAFKGLGQAERERLISDLIWRVTCHIEGSTTRVSGVNAYSLAADFAAVQSEQEGREIFCLTRGG